MSKIKVSEIAGSVQNAGENLNNTSVFSKQQPVKEKDHSKLLHKLGKELSKEVTLESQYQKIVDAAVSIMGSQYATMQLLYPEPGSVGKLRIVACYGFTPEARKYWEWIYHYTGSSCGEVLRTRRRVIVPDYRTCEFMKDAPTLPVFIAGGIYAAQSTPLYSPDGKLLGMISTHWSYPHVPSQHHLDMLDILAGHAVGLIGRIQEELPVYTM